MLHIVYWAFIICIAAVLSGCGGSGGSSDTPRPESPSGHITPPLVYGDLTAARTVLETDWGGAATVDPTSLPISGSADFDGIANMSIQLAAGELEFAGELHLTADFANETIGGSISDVLDENDQAYGGNLAIDNGTIDPTADLNTEYTFSADMHGSLTSAGTTLNINGSLAGDFQGASIGGAFGALDGLATGGGGTGALLGSFIVAQ